MKHTTANHIKFALTICMASLFLSGCDQLGAGQPKIAYVDVTKAINDSAVGKQEAEHNNDVKNVIIKAQADATEKYKSMTTLEQQKNREVDNQVLNQLWMAEQQHSRELSIKAVSDEAEKLRVSKGLDYVINSAFVLAAKDDANVTDELIKQLDKKKVAYGDLPKISVANAGSENSNPGASSQSGTQINPQ